MSDDVQPQADVQVQPGPAPAESEAPKQRQPRTPKPQVPSIGRIVRYSTTPAGKPRAAIITEVHDLTLVDVVVFNSAGAFPQAEVDFSEDGAPGTWSWPPRD